MSRVKQTPRGSGGLGTGLKTGLPHSPDSNHNHPEGTGGNAIAPAEHEPFIRRPTVPASLRQKNNRHL